MGTASARIRPGLAIGGYFDILGQSELLSKLQNRDLEVHSAEYVKDTVAALQPLLMAREHFRNAFFLSRDNRSLTPEQIASLNPEGQEEYRKMQKIRIEQSYFSDSFFVVCPLDEENCGNPVSSIYTFLLACSICYLWCLADRIALRGGVQIGIACELLEEGGSENSFSGPVLSETYQLESEIAEYPRIVIDHRVVREHRHLAALGRDPEVRDGGDRKRIVSGEFAKLTLRLMKEESDSVMCLDPTSSHLRDAIGDPSQHEAMILSAVRFAAASQQEHHRAGRHRIAIKYARLLHLLGWSASLGPITGVHAKG